jgi:dextranase
MTPMNPRPAQSTFAPGQDVRIEHGADAPAGLRLTVTSIARTVCTVPITGSVTTLGAFPAGGYGVDLITAEGAVLGSTAFDVLVDPLSRPRYGFVASYASGRDVAGVQRYFRDLHLNVAQFYDWAYRYTELAGPEEYSDLLGNEVSTPVLRSLIAAFREAGVRSLGYAAVYGVPAAEWDRWAELGLYRSTGEPYGFGEGFLNVVDPGNERWQAVLISELVRAARELGFDGFHLDQYGWPKQALRADGTATDLAESLPVLVDRIAEALPGADLIFNNVNGFPLHRTARSRQAALYTEVWEPRTELADLAALVAESRAAGSLPVIVSAYLTTFASSSAAESENTARLTMATIFSSGATHLLTGEDGRILVHPYYPTNHEAEPTSLALLERWYSFLVRYGDLLLAPDLTDVTGAYFGAYNADVVVEAPEGITVSIHPEPGTIWARVMRTCHGLTLHLINLTGQPEAGWDRPKQPIPAVAGLRLRLRQVLHTPGAAFWLDPDRPGPAVSLSAVSEGVDQIGDLPELGAWAVVHIPTPVVGEN